MGTNFYFFIRKVMMAGVEVAESRKDSKMEWYKDSGGVNLRLITDLKGAFPQPSTNAR